MVDRVTKDCPIACEAAARYCCRNPLVERGDEERLLAAKRMPDTADAPWVYLGTPAQVIQGPHRIKDHLCLERASLDQPTGKLEALVGWAVQTGMSALLEADEVGDERHIAPLGKFQGVVLLGISGQARRLALAKMELAGVLVQAEDCWPRCPAMAGEQDIGRDPFTGLGLIAYLLPNQAIQLFPLQYLGFQIARLRQLSQEAAQDLPGERTARVHFLHSRYLPGTRFDLLLSPDRNRAEKGAGRRPPGPPHHPPRGCLLPLVDRPLARSSGRGQPPGRAGRTGEPMGSARGIGSRFRDRYDGGSSRPARPR